MNTITTETLTRELKSRIKRGFVLHIDPDYLIKTYGDITTGPYCPSGISPRYALCIGVQGDATFWSLMTTQEGPHKQEIPIKARLGAWADNPITTFMSTDQIWVMTKDMAVEAHLAKNKLRSGMRWSWVDEALVSPWPDIPTSYPVDYQVKRSNTPAEPEPKPAKTVLIPAVSASLVAATSRIPAPAPQVPAQVLPALIPEAPTPWWETVRQVRERQGMSQGELARRMNQPYMSDKTISTIEKGARLFEPLELETWAFVTSMTGDPVLGEIPVATKSEMMLRQRMRDGRKATREHKKIGQPVLAPTQDPVSIDRAMLVTRATTLLSYRRITDQEAADLLDQLEKSFKDLLLSDLPDLLRQV